MINPGVGLRFDTMNPDNAPALNRALMHLLETKILCVSAGNDSFPQVYTAGGMTFQHWPSFLAPDRTDNRSEQATRNLVTVGNCRRPAALGQFETVDDSSCHGPQVSVSAPGTDVRAALNDRGGLEKTGGTSLASPYIAATIGQMFTLDATCAADPVKAIQYVEATADFLPNVPRDKQGWGLVNVWKAALSATNGCLSSQGFRNAGAHDLTFKSLAVRNHNGNEWYGFEIYLKSPGTYAYLYDGVNYTRLSDDGTPALAVGGADASPARSTYPIAGTSKAVAADLGAFQAVPETGTPLPHGSHLLGVNIRYLLQFSMKTDQMVANGGSNYRLRIFSTIDEDDEPLIDIPLNPVELRKLNNSTDPKVRAQVTEFDDFVFTVREP